jgi:hypothetical protein
MSERRQIQIAAPNSAASRHISLRCAHAELHLQRFGFAPDYLHGIAIAAA